MKSGYLLFVALFICSFVCIAFISSCDADDDDDNNDDDDDDTNAPIFDELLDFMQDEFDDYNVPGGSVAVVLDGELRYAEGVGVRKHGDSDPVTTQTIFVIASVTKMLTAAGLMTAWDEDLLDLDAPVTDYVPYFDLLDPADPGSISTHQSLVHIAGLPDYLEQKCDTDPDALSRWFKDNTDMPQWTEPDEVWNYSNLGYSLSSLVLEEVSGEYFTDAMQQRVFDPLGMVNMTYDPDVAMSGDYATGHIYGSGNELVYQHLDKFQCALGWGPGVLYGTPSDLAHFAEAMLALGGGAMSSDAAAQMQTGHYETRMIPGQTYGYGLMQQTYKELDVITHDGGIDGFLTTWWIVPERDFGVVIFINAYYFDPAIIAQKAMDLFLDLPDSDPPDYSTPPETWAKYTGTYNEPFEIGDMIVTQDEALKLWVEFPAYEFKTEMFQYAGDCFAFDASGQGNYLMATFWLNEQDVSEYFVTRAGVGERVTDKRYEQPDMERRSDFDAWVSKIEPITKKRLELLRFH